MCLTSVEVYEIGNWCGEKSGHNTIKDSDLLASHQNAIFDWDNGQQFLQVCLSGWILWVNAEMHEKVRSDSGMNEQNLLITVTHIYTYTPTYKINDPSLENDQNIPKSKEGAIINTRNDRTKDISNCPDSGNEGPGPTIHRIAGNLFLPSWVPQITEQF